MLRRHFSLNSTCCEEINVQDIFKGISVRGSLGNGVIILAHTTLLSISDPLPSHRTPFMELRSGFMASSINVPSWS
jgi:hypothetical protein